MTFEFEWDGRASFYPEIGYEIDEEHITVYNNMCEREGLFGRPWSEEIDKESDGESCKESDGEEDQESDIKHITYDVFNSPPLYDRKLHYHPLYDKDHIFSSIRGCNEFSGKELVHTLMNRRSQNPSGRFAIPNEALKVIENNRASVRSVQKGLDAMYILDARIVGLRELAPSRIIQVPGSTLLSVLHDQFLCAAFGWTRGYESYAFTVPPSGYEKAPPRSPMVDIAFGAAVDKFDLFSHFVGHGFYGTLRDSDPLIVDEDRVYLADLLQSSGHQLYHVLSTSSWKTVITVQKVVIGTGDLKPDILNGNRRNVPEDIVFDFDSMGFESDSCGPQAYAYALELLRRADLDEDNGWMRREALNTLGQHVEDSSIFDPYENFDLRTAKQAMKVYDSPIRIPDHFNREFVQMMFGGMRAGMPFDNKANEEPKCDNCQKSSAQNGKALKKCVRCQRIYYCSKECQKKSWKAHKKVCGKK